MKTSSSSSAAAVPHNDDDDNDNHQNNQTVEFVKGRHIAYFAQVLKKTTTSTSSTGYLPSAYSKLDTNRLTLVHFAVHALDVLGVWESSEIQLRYNLSIKSIREWIYRLYLCTTNECGFQGGTYVGGGSFERRSCSGGSGSGTTIEYQQSHIAMTYTALCTLQTLHLASMSSMSGKEEEEDAGGVQSSRMFWEQQDESPRLDVQSILKTVSKLQRSDGSFQCTIAESESDMRFLYCACAICYMLNDFSYINIDRAVRYIQSCKSYDGAIALIPGQEGHGGSTFCATAALQLLNRLDILLETGDNDSICWKDQLVQWCVTRQQQGGMQGRPNKAQDTCYSYWIGGTLTILGHDDLLNHPALRSFIFQCQHTKLGGFSKVIGVYPDLLHSFYSLAWLSLSNNTGNSNTNPNTDDDDIDGTSNKTKSKDDDDDGGVGGPKMADQDDKVVPRKEHPQQPNLPLHKLNCTLGIRQDRAVVFFQNDGRNHCRLPVP